MTISEDYEKWQRRLNGEKIGVYEDEPECGFYKVRLEPRSKQYLPVQIWKDLSGTFRAVKNGSRVDANNIWLYAVKTPITEIEYEKLKAIYHGE